MSKEVYEWSTGISNNVFAPADGGCAEGWTGKDVNNAARERMRAFAAWYRAQEFARTLWNETPYGAKSFTRISNTVFRVTGTTDYTSVFPVGRRLRVYDNVGGSIDAFVSIRTFGGTFTEVTVNGGPNLPATITDVGFTTNPSLGNLVYGGTGTTAERDAAFVTVPPNSVYWLNTTTGDLQIALAGAWTVVAKPGAFGASGASLTLDAASGGFLQLRRSALERLHLLADATLSSFRHKNAAGSERGRLEIDDDGEIYYSSLGAARQILTPGKVSGISPLSQFFTADGTWTKPAGVNGVLVIVLGGGGGGGGARSGSGSNWRVGGSGGAGALCIALLDVTSIASAAITIGAGGGGGTAVPQGAGGSGGSSIWNDGTNTLTAGGGGGGGVSLDNPGVNGASGAGGGASGGTINGSGESGRSMVQDVGGSAFLAPEGGSSPFGGGGAMSAGPSAGVAGTGFGSGGGGAVEQGTGGRAGGAGSPGFVYVIEFR